MRTEKQREATARNRRIWRLRGLRSQMSMLWERERIEKGEALVDELLIELGASIRPSLAQQEFEELKKGLR